MDPAQLKAIQAMLKRRTAANTTSPRQARDWIIRDGIHRRDGFLLNPHSVPADKPKKDE